MNILTKRFSTYLFILLMSAFTMAACSGEDGEPGPEGPIGPIGPRGQTGSTGPAGQDGTNGTNGQDGQDGEDANVTQYNYPAFDHTGGNVSFSIPVTAQVIGESVILAYAGRLSEFWYPIPGYVLNTFEYRGYVDYITGGDPLFFMTRVAGTGTQSFTGFRILVIPAITVTNGRAAGVDYNNYDEVAAYYGIVN